MDKKLAIVRVQNASNGLKHSPMKYEAKLSDKEIISLALDDLWLNGIEWDIKQIDSWTHMVFYSLISKDILRVKFYVTIERPSVSAPTLDERQSVEMYRLLKDMFNTPMVHFIARLNEFHERFKKIDRGES